MDALLSLPYAEGLEEMQPNISIRFKNPMELMSASTLFGQRLKQLYEMPKATDHATFLKRQFKDDIQGGATYEALFKQAMERLGLKVHTVPFWSHNYRKHIDFHER